MVFYYILQYNNEDWDALAHPEGLKDFFVLYQKNFIWGVGNGDKSKIVVLLVP